MEDWTKMPLEELRRKVKSGEIKSRKYNSYDDFIEAVKAIK